MRAQTHVIYLQFEQKKQQQQIPSSATNALQYFSTLSHRGRDFQEIVTEEKVCVLIFSTTLSKTFLIPTRYDEILS